MIATTKLIRQLPFFTGVSDENFALLAEKSSLLSAKQGQSILSQGAAINFLTFVVAGKIQAIELSEDKRVIGIQILSSGYIIGALALIDSQPSSVSLQILQDTQLLLLSMDVARQLVKTEPVITKLILQQLAQELRHSNEARAMLSIPNAFHRIFMHLNLLTNSKGAQPHIQSIPRQQDIAVMVNTSRETVSRALNILIRAGILTKTGHQLEIKEPSALSQLARDGLDALPKNN